MVRQGGGGFPRRVEIALESGESPVAALYGLPESGFALTDRRLFAWRAGSAGRPLPLAALDRVLVDTGPGSAHVDVLVVPRQAVHAPLVLGVRATDRERAFDFVERLIEVLGVAPAREHLGPILRLSFPNRAMA